MKSSKKRKICLIVSLILILLIGIFMARWLWMKSQEPLIAYDYCSCETIQDLETGVWRSINFDQRYLPLQKMKADAVKDLLNSLPKQKWPTTFFLHPRYRLILSNMANGGNSNPIFLESDESSRVRVIDIMDDGLWIRGEDVYYSCENVASRVKEVYESLPVSQNELYVRTSEHASIGDAVWDLGYLYKYDKKEKMFSLLSY